MCLGIALSSLTAHEQQLSRTQAHRDLNCRAQPPWLWAPRPTSSNTCVHAQPRECAAIQSDANKRSKCSALPGSFYESYCFPPLSDYLLELSRASVRGATLLVGAPAFAVHQLAAASPLAKRGRLPVAVSLTARGPGPGPPRHCTDSDLTGKVQLASAVTGP